jgi:hypothetical protein
MATPFATIVPNAVVSTYRRKSARSEYRRNERTVSGNESVCAAFQFEQRFDVREQARRPASEPGTHRETIERIRATIEPAFAHIPQMDRPRAFFMRRAERVERFSSDALMHHIHRAGQSRDPRERTEAPRAKSTFAVTDHDGSQRASHACGSSGSRAPPAGRSGLDPRLANVYSMIPRRTLASAIGTVQR